MSTSQDELNKQLLEAARTGNNDELISVLENGANIEATNRYGKTALIYASIYSHTETVTQLLAQGANIKATNNNGETVLMIASMFGRTAIVELIEDHIESRASKSEIEKNIETMIEMSSPDSPLSFFNWLPREVLKEIAVCTRNPSSHTKDDAGRIVDEHLNTPNI